MFENVGEKIKGLAGIVCWLGIIVCVCIGIGIISDAYYDEEHVIGWVVIIGGSICSWISSLFMYGFGELIENTCDICKIMRGEVQKQNRKTDRELQLNEWKEKGLITETEYQIKKTQLENEVDE